MRRADKLMDPQRAASVLANAYCGRVATVSADGEPYICPLLFLWHEGEVWFHTTSAQGHLARNLAGESRACFEVDVPGEVFPYGRFLCDTALAFQSVLVFGPVETITQRQTKAWFFDEFMARYDRKPAGPRPEGFYPRLDEVTVYTLHPARISGKETVLPAPGEQWPAVDRTRSPQAQPPA
jgi:nitroimidazol reductase NimA-like FMN-containing flavoprotein (pyridoxamine 5'-phosphate oxidase superfamily)